MAETSSKSIVSKSRHPRVDTYMLSRNTSKKVTWQVSQALSTSVKGGGGGVNFCLMGYRVI